MARYNSNGSLDITLNPPSGKVQTCVGSTWTRGYGGVIVQPVDGTRDKMIVAGELLGNFGLLRYTSDGQLDTTFNSTGVVTTPMGGNNSSAEAVTMQNGAILVVGNVVYNAGECSALVRYNLDGTLDTTFGTDGTGKVFTYANQGSLDFYDVAVYPAGSDHADYVVAAGKTYHNPGTSLTLARYTPDGTLDSGFGTGGIVETYNPAGGGLVGKCVALQPDGKIVAAGGASGKYLFIARYSTDGSLDTSFGAGTGTVTTAIPNLSGTVVSLLVQPDGKIVATGSHAPSTQPCGVTSSWPGTTPTAALIAACGVPRRWRSTTCP